jgi:hypothetical protein
LANCARIIALFVFRLNLLKSGFPYISWDDDLVSPSLQASLILAFLFLPAVVAECRAIAKGRSAQSAHFQ